MKIFSSLLFTKITLLLILIALCEAGFRIRRQRRSPPLPPNHVPIFTYCPLPWTERTTSMEKVVTWTKPTAIDDYSTPVVTLTSGPSPGSSLGSGTYRVTYIARDFHGLKTSCSFHFTVDVIRCPAIPSSNHRWHSCTYGIQGGSECSFSCHRGYRLSDDTTVRCNSDTRRWSSSFPTCDVMTCTPPLTSPANGSVSCTDGNRFMSTCSYSCNYGYVISRGQTSSRYCNGDVWSGSEPVCQDIKAPEFTFCPDSFDVTLDTDGSTNTETTVVNYDAPQAVDNSGQVRVRQIQGHASGSHFSSGSTTIIYRAEDQAENTADCLFTINVIIRSSSK